MFFPDIQYLLMDRALYHCSEDIYKSFSEVMVHMVELWACVMQNTVEGIYLIICISTI